MVVTGHLELTLEFLDKAEEQLLEYLADPTAVDDELPMIEGLLDWVRYCQWDLSNLKDSPKPAVHRTN
ncbi:hypothetical protein [Vreelandella olivaria]|uniref:hypothetical protein n=1 Tax=Vreelandella olivaria TaxID=390919 RepID=UPI00201EE62D|nr:hypothetical protein [Halomonas olivaria]